jgi:ferredoxin
METLSSMGTPVVELSCCILCEICVEVAPHAFAINDAGYVEVLALDDYSAVSVCPPCRQGLSHFPMPRQMAH